MIEDVTYTDTRHHWKASNSEHFYDHCFPGSNCKVCEIERKEVELMESGYVFVHCSTFWILKNDRGKIVGKDSSRKVLIENAYQELLT